MTNNVQLPTGQVSSEQNKSTSALPSHSLATLLAAAISHGASDLHVKAGTAPHIRIDGKLRKIRVQPMDETQMRYLIEKAVGKEVMADFDKQREIDFALHIPEVGRFRVNFYYEKQAPALAARVVSEIPLNAEALGLPEVIEKLATKDNGIIIVAGATGSGKSTTLAAIVDYINSNYSKNIITIEDPIEILHRDKRSIVSQRQVGEDTKEFSKAIRAALRQDPDVILVGEIRDAETARIALTAAETGHLVLSTLHTINATDSINRLVQFFPEREHQYIRVSLSSSLRAIICQRLIAADMMSEIREINGRKTSRIPVVEILVNEGRMPKAIKEIDGTTSIEEIIKDGGAYGMITFNQHLEDLVRSQLISPDLALRTSDSPDNLRVTLESNGLLIKRTSLD